jgi:hypothetical protein
MVRQKDHCVQLPLIKQNAAAVVAVDSMGGCGSKSDAAAPTSEPPAAGAVPKAPPPSLSSALLSGSSVEDVRSALAAGADPNEPVYGSLPLIFVMSRAKDRMGDYTKKNRGLDVLAALIDGGADVDRKTEGGLRETVLHKACFFVQPDFVKLLLARGADPNVQNNQGQNSLHVAAIEGSEPVLKLLLEGPIAPDRGAKTVTLETPADAAKNDAIRKYIEGFVRR